VPVAGGVQYRLNGDAGADGAAFDAKVSADSRWVVYRMRDPGEAEYHLYSAPIYGSIAGTGCIKLSGIPALGATGVQSFSLAPDGVRVVFTSVQDRADAQELFSVLIRGPASSGTRLNPVFPAGRYVTSFQITPNSARVVYLADQNTDNRRELYSVPIAGGAAPIRLTDEIIFSYADGEVDAGYQITPNSLGVVFRANPAYISSYDLYVCALDGSICNKLNPELTSGRTVSNFLITPNNWGVVYRSNFSGYYQLYSRDMFNTIPPRQLTNASGWQYVDTIIRITPNSQHVAYVADLDTDNSFELYSFPTLGTDHALTLRWNLPFPLAESDVNGVILMPDSSTLIYTADREIDEQMQIFYAYYAYPVYLPYTSR
jgi:hypothetical protein